MGEKMKKVISLLMSLCLVSFLFLSSTVSSQVEVQDEPKEVVDTHIITDEEMSLLYLCRDDTNFDTCILVSQQDAWRLMKIAKCEGGDDIKAQALIMRVIINRLEDESFPDSIDEIIHQEKQFSTVSNGMYDKAEPTPESHYALALVESKWDESEGAIYFEASFLKTSWQQKNRDFLFEYEGTRYYK